MKNKPDSALPEGVYLLPTETTVSLADGSHSNKKSMAEDNNASQITPTINGSTKHGHFTYDSSFHSPPKISFQMEPKTDF